MATIIAYLFALAALLLAMKVFLGFERQPVERPSKRWVMVRDDGANTAPSAGNPNLSPNRPARFESEGQNPARQPYELGRQHARPSVRGGHQ